MRWLTSKLGTLFSSRTPARKPHRPQRRRLELEALEDRSLPSANATGTITGTAFIDSNANGVRDPGENGVPGVAVTLTGSNSQGPVNTTATTDANGTYSFLNVLPGTYQLQAGPVAVLLGGGPSFGGTGGPGGVDTIGSITINGGDTLTQDLGFGGLAPAGVSLRELLTSTTQADFPFPSAGSGSSSVGPRANSAPFVKNAIANVSVNKNAADTTLDLSGNFDDPDITDTMVVFNTSAGPINVELFDELAPRTVANFLNYVQRGAYDNSIFHRLVSNFVLQGGGFTFDAANSTLPAIPTDPPVQNEFGTSNTIGTIAMAKVGSDPNSATNQFFFNLADNSSNLDHQNGGFTVFGKIVSSADQAVISTLASATISTQASPFDSIPLNNYNGTNFPSDTTAANYDLINNVQIASRTESLTYSVVGNSNPGLVTATVTNERLTLHYAAGATGSSSITVQATDQFGATATATFQVAVTDQPPTATIALSSTTPAAGSVLTATVTASDPDNDPVKLTYVWKVNGNVVKTTPNTASTTDTLDLSQPGNGSTGDTITVEVTPNDGTLNGAVATATATIS